MLKDNSKDEYIFDRKLDIQLKSIEEMNKYNLVVCSIGYVSLLAILSYLHNFINGIFLILICGSYVLSVAIFVIFEMKKVFLNHAYHYKVLVNLEKFRVDEIDKEALIKENNKAYLDCYKEFQERQKYYFIPSAIFGFGAGILIVLNFIPILLKFIIKTICSCGC